MKKLNIILSVFFSCCALLFFILSLQLNQVGKNELISSGTIPLILSILLFICSAVWLILTMRTPEPAGEKQPILFWKGNLLVPITMGLVFLYVFFMQLVGFFISTAVFLVVIMFLFNPRKNVLHIVKIVLISVCFNVTVYLLFSRLLRVYLP